MDANSSFVAYVVALSINAAIPGLGVTALIGQTLSSGMRASLFLLAGIVLGDVFYLTVAVAGLAAVVQIYAGAFIIIKIFGGIYLIYIAYKFWTSRAGLSHVAGAKSRNGFKSFLAGFAVTLSNPKTIVFYLALLPVVVELKSVTLMDWVELSILTTAVLTAVLLPYAFLASKVRDLSKISQALINPNRLAASVIGGAGILILGQAVLMAPSR